jgi:hypothetical protein
MDLIKIGIILLYQTIRKLVILAGKRYPVPWPVLSIARGIPALKAFTARLAQESSANAQQKKSVDPAGK